MNYKTIIKSILRKFGIDIVRYIPKNSTSSQLASDQHQKPVRQVNVLALAISDHLRVRAMSGLPDQDFTVVQIGAYDGRTLDPIRRFIDKYSFRGVLIEPQPEAFANLKSNYAGSHRISLVNAAISETDGTAKMYRFKAVDGAPDWVGLLTSFSLETLKNNYHNVKGEIEEIIVPTLSIQSLLKQFAISQIDLLQIDTEGFDYDIIKMVDFATCQPAIIHFEHGFLSEFTKQEAFSYLSELGYAIANNGPDTLAYHEPSWQANFSIAIQAD